MAQTAAKVFFDSRHDGLEQELNQWLGQVSGEVVISGISMDSNDYGHCLAIMYQAAGGGKLYRGHVFFNHSHTSLEGEANQGLSAAQAQSGKWLAIGSNQHGHCLCVIEEQEQNRVG